MPAIHEKYKCTGGEIFCYVNAINKWYYRIYIKEQRKYKYRLIPNATNAIEAMQHVGSIEVLPGTQELPILHYIDAYINHEEQRHNIGQIATNTLLRKQAFVKRLRLYCTEYAISTVDSIRRATFNNWATYFKIRSKLSLQLDHKHIRHWLNYLVLNEIIPNDPVILPKLRIHEDDLSSNPPVSEHDWQLIMQYIHKWEKAAIGRPNYRHHWWRYVFRHFVHIAKRSGLRPSELCNLRWCDVEIIENPKSIQEDSMATLTVRRSKTHSSRRVPTVMGRELRRLHQWQVDELALRNKPPITTDSYIFIDINHKQYDVPAFSKCWRELIMPPLKGQLEGDKTYGKPFTLYSLRSSFINDQLRDGTDVFLLAKAAGHSVKTLQRYYERFDITKREDELATLPIGRTKAKVSPRTTL
jgi:integrase